MLTASWPSIVLLLLVSRVVKSSNDSTIELKVPASIQADKETNIECLNADSPQWYLDGIDITANVSNVYPVNKEPHEAHRMSTFVFDRKDNAKVLSCKSDEGSDSVVLNVTYKPELKDWHVRMGDDNIHIECLFDANPMASVKWRAVGDVSNKSLNYEVVQGNLVIREALVDLATKNFSFNCKACNSEGCSNWACAKFPELLESIRKRCSSPAFNETDVPSSKHLWYGGAFFAMIGIGMAVATVLYLFFP